MSNARIPVKVHRRVSLVLVEDATLAEELLARPWQPWNTMPC